MKINEKRLLENIENVGSIGREADNGITRLAYSKEYKEASNILKELMEASGLEVHIDGVGNIFGRRKGLQDDLPSIMVGSHLDTVKGGGLYDGNLGVNAALEIINVLNESNYITKHPIEVVAFNAEEGNEMGGTFGSRVMSGLQDPNASWLDEKLLKYGMVKQDVKNSVRDMKTIKAFLELHIEQGGSLYAKGLPIGVVNGIVGITRYNIVVTGETNHAGTTPMGLRIDALTGAAKLIGIIDSVSRSMGDPFVSTVGVLEVFPCFVNVIPGRVEMSLDMRDLDQSRIECAIKQIELLSKGIENVGINLKFDISKPPVKTDKNIVGIIEKVCQNKGLEYQVMPSGAGHDAKATAEFIPTGMIFVPSIYGKSHCKEEDTEPIDLVRGTEVLLDTLMEIDKNL
ncbi:MAG TPA: M20 family metallo-hydrolase [Clostridia bacterium]|nr:M20 family metallo-hydrolase [Clostridia bacterium]